MLLTWLLCSLLVLGIELTCSRHKWHDTDELRSSILIIVLGPVTLALFVLIVVMRLATPNQ